MTIKDIRQITQGTWLSNADSFADIHNLCIDTRLITNGPTTLFIALKGDQKSGSMFLMDAYQKGVRNFIVEENVIFSEEDANIIQVSNSLTALQKLGGYKRNLVKYPVVGITGSNGKTIVKEWLSKILSTTEQYSKDGGVIKSPKSYNSQIGVPLSTWNMEWNNTIGIFEAGISKPNEMENLEKILQPEIGIFTHIGDAHDEFFTNRYEKLCEKFKLFIHSKILILNLDIPNIDKAIDTLKAINPSVQIFSWTLLAQNAIVKIIQKKIQRHQCHLQFIYQGKEWELSIPFTQEAYIQNAINVLCTLLYLQIPYEIIKEGIARLKAVAMRLEVRDAINDSYIIADTYNADLSSLKVALDFLSQQIQRKRTVILSDLQETGNNSDETNHTIAQMIQQYKISKFIGIGEEMIAHRLLFESIPHLETYFFHSTDDFLKNFSESTFSNEHILLKGARKFELERIQTRLELKIHHTVLEVDLNALGNNFKIFKKQILPETKIMAMVKAHSYGSGGLEVAQKLAYEGVDYLTVAYVDEGIELRNSGISLPIMVMSPEIHSFESMIRWRLEPEIFNIHSLQLFIQAAIAHQEIRYPIHIKLDTGMHRLGFESKDVEEMMRIIQRTETIKIASIFSHLVGSDDTAFESFTLLQAERFQEMTKAILNHLSYRPLLHLCNSAGIINYPSLQLDMVRLGIGLYGLANSSSANYKFQNVSTLKTYIVQIRDVPKDETVGYSRKGVLYRDSKIATVAIGYADGYFRSFGNEVGYMLVRGQKAKVIGSVCMDMCMLDVTDIVDVQEGDEVIVFGKELPVETLAKWANTIGYEILTSISKRVKRIYVND